MIGRTLAHYRIDGRLGKGGMGEVYRAHDLTLGRDVALKVLPLEYAKDPERLARLQREARALASLNHPNIITVFEVGAAEPYLAMELVTGRSLQEIIPRDGLPSKELFEIAVPLTNALAVAHDHGIIHRDLKAGNVMVTEGGRVKVLDFGLAKMGTIGQEETGTVPMERTLTQEGALLGTLPYMAPEQIQGKPCDRRSDIFSLGVLLYEMATGRRPFRGESFAEVASAILRDAAPDVIRFRDDLPRDLGRIIRRCLEKDPERRFQSAKDVRNELEDIARELGVEAPRAEEASASAPMPAPASAPTRRSGRRLAVGGAVIAVLAVTAFFGVRPLMTRGPATDPPAAPEVHSLAVLPFTNLMNDPDQEYFVDGMHEQLITDLSKVRALRVISRTSAMHYRDTDMSIPEIAHELGVDAVIEGSVLRAGDQVRITAQLIHGASDRHLWAESYDRDLENVLVLLSDVAQAITREIAVAVTPEEQRRLVTPQSVDPEIHDLYLRARFHLQSLRPADLLQAQRLYEEVVAQDPGNAPARAGLSTTLFLFWFFKMAPYEETVPQAEAMARSALEIDPDLADGYACLGAIQLYAHWDWDEAKRSLNKAVELAGNDVWIRHALADYYVAMGDLEESLRQVRLGLESDPFSRSGLVFLAAHLGFARHFDEALAAAERGMELYPDYHVFRVVRASSLWQLGRYEESLAAYQEQWGEDPIMEAMRAGYERGGPSAANEALADFMAAEPSPGFMDVAARYAAAGNADQAFAWLERAYEAHTPQLPHMVGDVDFDPIRSDPRYGEMLRRMRLPT